MSGQTMDGWLSRLPKIKKIHTELIRLTRPFEDIAACFAQEAGTVVLLSGSTMDCARYHILAVNPWLEVSVRQDSATILCQGSRINCKADPFLLIQALLDRFKCDPPDLDVPVFAGLFGYFAYDLKDRIEELPRTCMATNLPDLCLYAPSAILIQDKETHLSHLFIPVLADENTLPEDEKKKLQTIRQYFLDRLETGAVRKSFSIDLEGFHSSLTKPEYLSAVQKIIAYLKSGDIYQANLSQRFETGFKGDTYALFLELFERNPAAFFSYINAGNHVIVSTSPERFIKQTGQRVETRPIKGTIARGKTCDQDRENGLALSRSIKDDAELTMIVDLMRNDLSRVTCHGSVTVREHKRLEPYENVFHLVSVVEATLEQGKTAVDLLQATFPGGSITGCPKIRAMEIIDELEPVKRHVYTGAIGYLSFHDTMDLSIAIRTATISQGRVFFSVGGGIVYDSDPEKEYQETLDKGKTLMDALRGAAKEADHVSAKAWVDGKIVDQDHAVVSATSTGFQYGAGVFETIRVDRGTIFRLPEHVDRMEKAWQQLFSEPAPDITWKHVIQSLIRENNFEKKQVAVKLVVCRDEQKKGRKFFLAAFVREYVPRLELLGKTGLDLVTYPHPRQTPLADYKTLNYLFYEQAGRFARSQKADEAIILNPDQTISETHTAGLLAIQDKRVIVPASVHVLDSISLKFILTILSDQGYDIVRKRVSKSVFYACPNIVATNALMGAVKVLSIDGTSISHDLEICPMINELLFELSCLETAPEDKS